MASSETFRIEFGTGAISCAMHAPATMSVKAPVGAVVLCQGVHIAGEDAGEFLDAVTESLAAAGLAVVRFEHRCAELILDDFDAHSAADDLNDALAVHAWLKDRPDIDSARIGVLGYSLGAIAATALARRLESINRVCLLAAATARFIRDNCTANNGQPATDQSLRLPASYLPSLEAVDSSREMVFHNRPTLVIHGAADRFIPATVSLEYVRALELGGRDVEHVLVARGDHTFSPPSAAREACLDRVSRFLAAMEVVAATATSP
jgi:dipeptidyl aminopeptidase/acylaminoacyl peptidase